MHDFHTHFIPNDVLTWLKDNQKKANAKWTKKESATNEFLIVNEKWGFELKQTFIDLSLYKEEQGKAGITHSLISPIPQLFMYDAELSLTNELSQVYNNALSQITESSYDLFSALGTVPLQHPEKAAMILQDVMKSGLNGVVIGPGLPGHMLSDDFFKPFFEEANKLKAIVFIHPLLSEDPRLKRRMMPNLIGVPWETTVCATDLLLSGFIDTYPNVKLLFAHGGGFLPYQLGRMDKGFEQWKAVSANLQAPPSEYAKRFWYDNVLWNEDSIDFLVKTVGAERVVPGSDFPFDLAQWPPKIGDKKAIQTLLFE
ncbi:amidohydrolase family protein [Bacillus sp. FJAT-50079]|uniref:amidohydrolase family protein n=1 Tax=Bacillus sp. FJAT-50079 TaxID=2833577 RepID=UPI001BC96256|nr:amidohydrolase family protein [Bacillus sp. FJAT-50079]MBS4208309.1 amidohydrolase [Bacillus sp. FJAT-50079]